MMTSGMPQESSPRKPQKAIRKLQKKKSPPKLTKCFKKEPRKPDKQFWLLASA
jgi:hypothetical protein